MRGAALDEKQRSNEAGRDRRVGSDRALRTYHPAPSRDPEELEELVHFGRST